MPAPRTWSRVPRASAFAIVALLLATTALATAPAGAAPDGDSSCATPEVCATVNLDKSLTSVSVYGATAPTRVTATGAIHVETQVGHFVDLDITIRGAPWDLSVTPTHVRIQTATDIPFSATLDVPPDAPEGSVAFTVRALDNDNLFPIDASGTFEVAVFRGPLALFSAPITSSPLPGGTATWRLTLRNLASFAIDYNPIFEVPDGYTSHVQIPATQIIQPGREAEVVLDLTVPGSAAPGPASWSVRFESQTHPEVSVGLTQPFAVLQPPPVPTPGGDDLLARYWVQVAFGAAALGAVLFLSLTEVGYLALAFSLLVPLFTRLKPDKVLDNFTRGQIYGYIRANPGTHYSEIHDALELQNGPLSYHLRVLLREEYVVSRNEGIYKRFYPRDYKVPKRRRSLTRLQVDILEAVDSEPGLTQRALARQLGESRQVVSYNVRVLREAGLLRGEASGRGATVAPTGETAGALEEARAARTAGEPVHRRPA